MNTSIQNGVICADLVDEIIYQKDITDLDNLLGSTTDLRSVIIDCRNIKGNDPNFLKGMEKFAEVVKKKGGKFQIVANKELASRMQSNCQPALTTSMVILNVLQSLKDDSAIPPEGVISTISQTLAQAIVKTMGYYLKVDPQVVGPQANSDLPNFSKEIAGIVEFVYDGTPGAFILSFPKFTFLNLVSVILGEDHKLVTPEIIDWGAELLNMSSNIAKESLNRNKSIVSFIGTATVLGQDNDLKQYQNYQRMKVDFQSELGPYNCWIFKLN